MNGYLLDTNICIFALREEHGITERLLQCGESCCYVSDITVMELRFGAYKSNKTEENLTIVNDFLKKLYPLQKPLTSSARKSSGFRRWGGSWTITTCS